MSTNPSSARVQRMLSRLGEARRWRLEIIHGTARSVESDSGRVDFELDGRKVRFALGGGEQVMLSDGNDLFVIGRRIDPFVALAYFNETTDTGSIDLQESKPLSS